MTTAPKPSASPETVNAVVIADAAPCSAGALRYAANEVAKLAAHLVGNTKTDGTRDPVVYGQGIGCELASKMLLEQARIIERMTAPPNADFRDPAQ